MYINTKPIGLPMTSASDSSTAPTLRIAGMEFARPTAVPVLMTMLLVGVCLALGIWQLQRLEWKEGLLAELARAQQEEKIYKEDLPENLDALMQQNFYPIQLAGEWLHEHELHIVGRSLYGEPGFNLYTPLRIADDGRLVLVNRGWVPQNEKPKDAVQPERRPEGIVFVNGFISVPQGGSPFLPDHDVAGNLWFWPDTPRIRIETGLELPDFVIEQVEAAPREGALPIARSGYEVQMRNDHLHYALMWFSL